MIRPYRRSHRDCNIPQFNPYAQSIQAVLPWFVGVGATVKVGATIMGEDEGKRNKQAQGNPLAVSKRIYNLVSRARDIVFASVGLILLAPLFFGLAIWVKRDTPGPIFYGGLRVGKHNKLFRMWKFRSMAASAGPENHHRVTGKDDPRITPAGRWLRGTKLNELPQLWNVLRGEMSLVGPRPEDPEIVKGWPETAQEEVLSVRPGITSPASVLFRNEEQLLDLAKLMETYLGKIQPDKLRLDRLYVRHRSFWLDLNVLLWTLLILLPRLGGSDPDEPELFAGPLSWMGSGVLTWFVADLLVAFAAFGTSGLMWRTLGPIDVGVSNYLLLSLGFALLFSLISWMRGIHNVEWSKASTIDFIELLASTSLAGLAAGLLSYWLMLIPVVIVILAAIFSFLGFIIIRFYSRIWSVVTRRGVLGSITKGMGERILIVGSGDAGQFAAWMLENSLEGQNFQLVGYVDDDVFRTEKRIRGVKILGTSEELENIVKHFDVGIIIFAIHNIQESERTGLLRKCYSTGARTVIMPDMLGHLQTGSEKGIGLQRTVGKPHQFEAQFQTLELLISEAKENTRKGDFAIARGKLAEIENLAGKLDLGDGQQKGVIK